MYVKTTQNGDVEKFPYSLGDLRKENPNTSFPKTINENTLNSFNVFSVTVLEEPSFNTSTQYLKLSDTPVLNNGSWEVGYTVVNRNSDEQNLHDEDVATENKLKRMIKLAETDWWASSDLTMTAEQTAYRQALRDITTHANWPHLEEADWPTKP